LHGKAAKHPRDHTRNHISELSTGSQAFYSVLFLHQGLPPKGQEHNVTRALIENINNQVDKLVCQSQAPNLAYLDCPSGFVNAADGSISVEDFWDFLHFTETGYAKFFGPLLAYLESILDGN
jgi:hypothetical protein